MPVFVSDGTCVACGNPNSDSYGDHSVGCASQGERIARHNHLRDALFHTAVSAQLAPFREERALLTGMQNARPADVMIPRFGVGGRHLCLDVSVVSSLQSQLVDRAAEEPGYALEHRSREKWNKYGEACQAEGLEFQALPLEVLGGWGDGAVKTIKRLGQALARAGGQQEAEVTRHLFGRLSVLLMQGNAQLVLSRKHSHPKPHINGIM